MHHTRENKMSLYSMLLGTLKLFLHESRKGVLKIVFNWLVIISFSSYFPNFYLLFKQLFHLRTTFWTQYWNEIYEKEIFEFENQWVPLGTLNTYLGMDSLIWSFNEEKWAIENVISPRRSSQTKQNQNWTETTEKENQKLTILNTFFLQVVRVCKFQKLFYGLISSLLC